MSELKYPEGWLSIGMVCTVLKRRIDVIRKMTREGYFDSALQGSSDKVFRYNLNQMSEEELVQVESTRKTKAQDRPSRKGAHLIKDWMVENRMAKAAKFAGDAAERKQQFLRDLAEEHEREAGMAGEVVDAVLIPPLKKIPRIPEGQAEAQVVQGLTKIPPRSTNMADLNRRASTNKKVLSARFLEDVYSDWETHGLAVLKIVRRDRPQDYLKVVASLLPRDIQVAQAPLTEMSDEEIVSILANIKSVSAIGSTGEVASGTDAEDASERDHNVLP